MKKLATVLLGGQFALLGLNPLAGAPVDRQKLLTEPGVYATFAVFKLDGEWWKSGKGTRQSAIAEAKQVIQQHAETVTIDTYLLRGLSDRGDFMVRVHSTELLNNQSLLVDLMATGFGRHLDSRYACNGLTKKENYVPDFPEDLKAGLKSPSEPGPKAYAIVVPIRKDAHWWLLPREARTGLMKEHTEASIPYLKTVSRKLYHSTGLDDLDFITYFETAKLEDFNSLVIALQRVKENRHNRIFGSPIVLATIRPVDELLEILAR